MGPKVVCTRAIMSTPYDDEVVQELDGAIVRVDCPTEDAVIEACRDADAAMGAVEPFSRRVIEQLDRGAWVGMLADRAIHEGGMVAVPFLGSTALFPAAPFRIAALTGRAVILMIGLYRYDLHFETLVEAPSLPRAERDQILESWIRLYAARLEHYCRESPFNWFNFYDFWSSDDKVT